MFEFVVAALLCCYARAYPTTPAPPGASTFCHVGVRYASADRWKAPVVNLTATHVQTQIGCQPGASNYGDSCPQAFSQTQPWLKNMSEDCLYLQVYAPTNIKTLKPVMVFFYGGSFDSGTSAIPIYNGQPIASFSRDTVVVAANYRLGALGFLASLDSLNNDNTTGAYGLLDQVAALQWVQARISDYGGDPNNVSIFGESAGGASVCALMTMSIADGLFHRVIVESGVCQDAALLPAAFATANSFASIVGCRDGNDTTCLNLKTWQDIIAAQSKLTVQESLTTWAPAADRRNVLRDIPIVSMAKQRVISSVKAVIVGINANESNIFLFSTQAGRSLTVNDLTNQVLKAVNGDQTKAAAIVQAYLPSTGIPGVTAASLALAQMTTDRVFVCPAASMINFLNDIGTIDVYSYVFAHVPTCSFVDPKYLPMFGAFHGAELPFVFGTRSNAKCSVTALEEYLSDRMIEYWSSFAAGNAPTASLDGTVGVWPLSTVSGSLVTSVMLDVAYDSIVTGYRANFCKLWN